MFLFAFFRPLFHALSLYLRCIFNKKFLHFMHFSAISSSGIQDRMANTNEDGGGQQAADRLEVVREAVSVRCSKKEYNTGKLACEPGFIYLVVLENPNYLFPSISVLHSVELVGKNSPLPPYELVHMNSVGFDLGTGSEGGESNNNSNGRPSSSTPRAAAASSKKGRQPRSKSAKPATASSHSSVGITPQPQRPPIPEADREAKIEDLLNFVFEITAADAARRQKTGNIDSGRATSKKASSSRTRGQSETEKTTVEATIEAAPRSKGSSSSSSKNDTGGAKKKNSLKSINKSVSKETNPT